jgi:hypothetical protein
MDDWPAVDAAERYLAEGAALNSGPWVDHSRVVARAARAIAERDRRLDPERAYVLGLLHDVGRRTGGPGVADVRHLLDGYYYMRAEGFDGVARICLTHSFPPPLKSVDAFASRWICPAEERQLVQAFLDGVEYTPYDRLIQLCDTLSLPTGFCLIERRLVDVVLRHGFNALTLDKWRAYLGLREEFDQAVGGSIYRLLPGVVEHTFGFPPPAASLSGP